ncbi:MAG: gliding motility-associated C-terminal domain-containing protein [Bacteroidia bacterium]|nr:gliding motility-associated C-terminal domain-containing protein [Bacteroidia bacterium]
MIGRKFLLILASITLSLAPPASGTHIVGGDFTYRWLNGNYFEIKLKVYRDCNPGNAGFDQSVTIGIFDKATDILINSPVISLTESNPVTINGPSSSCPVPSGICVEYALFIDTVFIADNPGGYYLVWERCCRNSTILNMQEPLRTGMAFCMEMPDPALHNSSPQFLNNPLPFFCESQPLNYNFTVSDPDGDSVVYELVTPLAGNTGLPNQSTPITVLPSPLPAPYPLINWQPGYSLSNICNSNPALSINSSTGEITVTAQNLGMYAMAVLVREYRNGIMIGCVRREIEFSVILCIGSNPQLYVSSGSHLLANNHVELFANDTLNLLIQGFDTDDSLWLLFNSEIFQPGSISPPFAAALPDSGFLSVSSVLTWITGCNHVRNLPYKIEIILKDHGCPLPFTQTDSLFIQLKDLTVIKPELKCIGLRESDQAEIIWKPPSVPKHTFNHTEIYRSTNGSPFVLIGSVSNNEDSSFTDPVAFNYLSTNYCYFVRLVGNCGESSIHSDTVCTITQFNSSIINMRNANVISKNQIEINWQHFPDWTESVFHLFRKENVQSSSFSHYKSFSLPSFDSWMDYDVRTSEKSYCYYMVNEDYCKNKSIPGNIACSILLTAKADFLNNNLNWNAYYLWDAGVSRYEIYKRPSDTNQPFKLIASVGRTDTTFTDSELELNYGRYDYNVIAYEDTTNSGMRSSSNEITISQGIIGYLPSAFTPNKDGMNDTWKMESSFVKSASINIFNRWGQLIFHSDNKNFEWDGTFRNIPVPEGSYFYTINLIPYSDTENILRSGVIQLIR